MKYFCKYFYMRCYENLPCRSSAFSRRKTHRETPEEFRRFVCSCFVNASIIMNKDCARMWTETWCLRICQIAGYSVYGDET